MKYLREMSGVAKAVGTKCVRPLVRMRASLLASQLLESESPGTGPYYFIRWPDRWDLYPIREDEYGDIDHTVMWEEYVSPALSEVWAKALGGKVKKGALYRELFLAPYAFPRGRVSRYQGKYKVHYGKGTDKLYSKNKVETIYGITGRCVWEPDEHEQCQAYDRDAVRELLGIKETWPAV